MKLSKGTLLALAAIAIAIIGGGVWRSSQAAAEYNEYMLKAKFAEAMVEAADPIKTAVAVYYVEHNDKWPSSLQDTEAAEYMAHLPTKLVQTVSLAAEGVFRVTFRADVAVLGGKSIALSPAVLGNGDIKWKCSAPDIPANYHTKSCP